jgi:hypothetical protein
MVDYLMDNNLASSRLEGVSIGQELLMTLGTVEHVVLSTGATTAPHGGFNDDTSSLYRFSEHQILLEISTLLQSNLQCRTHSHHFKKYKRCFVGSEMVDYLIENNLASSRADGVEIGQDLILTLGTVENVSTSGGGGGEQPPQRHGFKDDSSFYRFRDRSSEKNGSSGDDASPPHSPCEATTILPDGIEDGARGMVIKVDKYGFLIDDHDAPLTTTASKEDFAELLRPSDAKWEKLLEKITPITNNNNNAYPSSFSPSGLKRAAATTSSSNLTKVKNYARRGLPDSVRPKAWTMLTGVDVMMSRYPRKYDALVQKAEKEYRKHHEDQEIATVSLGNMCCNAMNGGSYVTAPAPPAAEKIQASNCNNRLGTVLDTIERDIHRTFPKHYLFHSGFDETKDDDIGNGIEVDSDNIASDDDDDEGDVIKERYSSTTNDDIEIDENTGLDPTFDVEAKKKMFNESMNTLMTNIGCGALDNVASNVNENAGAESNETQSTDCPGGSAKDDGKPVTMNSQHPPSVEGKGLGHGQNSLRRVLRAYSMYDTEVGYCQGMNYIAAMFLTFLSEEKAFWLLVVVMNDKPYKLRDLFGEDMAGAHEVLFIAEKLLAQFLPKLSKHLEAESIHMSMFVTPWLLTAYTSTFPFDLVARVWDCFLIEGWKVLYRVMLSLLEFASTDISDLQFEQILSYFRDFPTKINGREILASSLKIGLKKKHIQKHSKEWKRHAGGGGGKK